MSCINPEILSFQSTPLKVLFASETGNSAKVAQMIHIQALKRGFFSSIHSLNQNLFKFNLALPWNSTSVQQSPLSQMPHICIIVCSSTGNGDPPKNGEKFIKYLRRNRKNSSLLRHVRFAIMGLGDSNYTKYQGVPIYVQEKMKQMGAVQIYKRGQVDDAYSQPQEVVVPWISSLWQILDQVAHIQRQIDDVQEDQAGSLSPSKGDFKLENTINVFTPTKTPNKTASYPLTCYDYMNPARVRIKKIQIITEKQAIKPVKLITLDLSALPIQFEVEIGGSISIFPENRQELVLKFLNYFQNIATGGLINNHRLIHELQKKYDLISQIVPLSFLNALKDFLPNQGELIQLYNLIQNYNSKVKKDKLNTIEALDMILGCDEKLKIYSEEDFSILISKLPQIKPRIYSIIQNPDNDSQISFALSLHSFGVTRKKQEIIKTGFCSRYLDNVAQGNYLSTFPMTNSSIFRELHPSSFKFSKVIPSMLFFAHGTSIAPILSYLRCLMNFIQENQKQLKSSQQSIKIGGPISLFYGCRSCDEYHCDFLFKAQIQGYFSFLQRRYHKDCHLKIAESYEKVIQAQKGFGDECEIGEWHGIQVNSQYVYDLVTQNDEIVERLVLQDEGVICLCGEGSNMSRVVEDRVNFVIHRVKRLQSVGNKSTPQIMQYLAKQNRYYKETWTAQ